MGFQPWNWRWAPAWLLRLSGRYYAWKASRALRSLERTLLMVKREKRSLPPHVNAKLANLKRRLEQHFGPGEEP